MYDIYKYYQPYIHDLSYLETCEKQSKHYRQSETFLNVHIHIKTFENKNFLSKLLLENFFQI